MSGNRWKHAVAIELGITMPLKFLMKIPYAYVITLNVVEFLNVSETA